jgi:hypothetical protein
MKPTCRFTIFIFPLIAGCMALSGCGPSSEQQNTLTTTTIPFTSASWTSTLSLTSTLTSTYTLTVSSTPTITHTPTITPSPTITPTPTFAFPRVTVNKDLAACMWGPATAYLWGWDLHRGDTGTVYGRSPVGTWLYVYMDQPGKYCWISPYVVDVTGDPKTVTIQQILLPVTNDLYAAPTNIRTVRDGDQVTVMWDEVWMTQDDDNGYFLDVWVCQDGNYVWSPTHMENQFATEVTFSDEPGCPEASGGKIYTVEKHGYTDPADIPWPPFPKE